MLVFSFENLQKIYSKNLLKSLLASLLLNLILSSAVLAGGHPCEQAAEDLHGDMDVVGNRGGLWSLMEQKGLQDNSIIGMQADGKLARAVGRFDELCASEKKPGKQIYIEIQALLGDARVIFNPRSSGEAIVKKITALNKKLDAQLAKME